MANSVNLEGIDLEVNLPNGPIPVEIAACFAVVSIAVSLRKLAVVLSETNDYGEHGFKAMSRSIKEGLRDG